MPLSKGAMGGLLARGMLCGIVAGICAFLLGHQIGEPQIDRAIAFEDHLRAVSGAPPDVAIFSREVQSGIGLFTAIVIVGTALGGCFAIGCALLRGRVGALRMRAISLCLAVAGFLTIALVPSLKYPANPPSIGLPATIGLRTELFFSCIALSLCSAILGALIARMCAPRWGAWNAALAGALVYIVTTAIAQALLPNVSEVPPDFPAVVLWKFRVASLETQAILWGVLGLSFGAWCERDESERRFVSN